MTTENNLQGEHYNLRWNNYFTNLVQVFTELRQQEQMVDVTLVCENQSIKAHKIILSACSTFFMKLFRNMTGHHPVVTFHDIEYVHLKHIINFLYQGEVKVLDVDLEGVLNLGEKFQVKGLSSVKFKHKVAPSESEPEDEFSKNGVAKLRYEVMFPGQSYYTPKVIKNMPIKVKVRSVSPSSRTYYSPGIVDKRVHKRDRSQEEKHNLLNCPNDQSLKKFKVIPKLDDSVSYMLQSRKDNKKSSLKQKQYEKSSKDGTAIENNFTAKNAHSLKVSSKITEQDIIDLDNKESNQLQDENLISDTKRGNVESESNSTISEVSKNSPSEIKKPANAFILFSKEWRNKLEVEHSDEDYKSISVRLGHLWKSLSSETRESYYMAAREEQLNYQKNISNTDNVSPV